MTAPLLSFPAVSLTDAYAVLARVFGFSDFRPGQAEIIAAVLAGENLLAIMPTGGGKSLCYQLPALLSSRLTVVISPLIALMRDQVAQLRAYGVAAASLNSSTPPEEAAATLAAVRAGTLRLLYLSPERLLRPETARLLAQADVATFAVDEAHCVSQWGHDFRREYQEIGRIAAQLGIGQILALTATADSVTRADIEQRLFPAPPRVFVHSFDRPNIRLTMTPRASGKTQLLQFLSQQKGQNGIVYCQSRKRVDDVTAFLAGRGYGVYAYHAGMSNAERATSQDAFMREEGVIVVATVAFGMGVDKPDVRFVFHMDLPKNIEGYYQEIGRAGRDGQPAVAALLYGMGEVQQYRQWIEQSEAAEPQKHIERNKLNALVGLAEAVTCRRVTLLGYFGETSTPCGNCDLCLGTVATYDATIEAQKALSAAVRTREIFGREHLIAVLRGEKTPMVVKHGHTTLPTFGVGSDRSGPQWRAIFRQLYALGLFTIDDSEGYQNWRVTPAGWAVMRGQAPVHLRLDSPAKAAATAPAVSDESAANPLLLSALKTLRRSLAQEGNVPAYVIFSDKTLIDMATRHPKTLDAFRTVHGVGEKKLEQFGPAFLAVLTAG